jgi:outer membrane lipoprotein-sorting protein
MRKRKLSVIASVSLTACLAAAGAELSPLALSWISSQTRIQTWSASFVQTRTLPSLVQPIALRATNDLWLIYPRLKRAERYPLDSAARSTWRAALQLLEAGFPRSRAEVEAQYVLLSETLANGACQLVFQPRAAGARKVISQIRLEFNASDLQLQATELAFADGSKMRNDFSRQAINPPLDQTLFEPAIPADFKIVTPMNRPTPP